MVRGAEGTSGDQGGIGGEEAGDGVDLGHLERLLEGGERWPRRSSPTLSFRSRADE